MKTKVLYLLSAILFMLAQQEVLAQNPRPRRYIDSLRRELKIAGSDTTKIKLRYEISEETGEGFRVGYWDTLVKEAHTHHLYLIECKALNNLGYLHYIHNDTSDFLDCVQKGTQLAEVHRYYAMVLVFYNSLSHYYIQTLQLNKALNLCFKGLKLAEEVKDKNAILDFNNGIGSVYRTSGDFKKTLAKRMENLKIYVEEKDSVNICVTLISLGDTYCMIGDLGKASSYYLKSARFFKENFPSQVASVFYNAMGSGYHTQKQYDSAGHYFTKSYKLSEARGAKKGVASSLALLARNNYEMGNNKEAKNQALKALQLCKTLNFTTQLPDLALTLKDIYLKDKNYKAALEAYELSVTTRDSLSNEKNRKLASQKELDYEFEKKENENKLLAQQNQIQSLELRQNNYFLLGMGAVLVLVSIIGYLFIRQNKIKAERQSSQLEQKLLLSQMNPHFIFNSLQAIQNFILKHNEKEAVKYLSSFAAVTRNVLENSRMEVISLKKEITLLENYLQLQKLRFRNRFDYEIKVDEMIDTENTIIPPMLAQPFIENSVEHGFHDIEEGKITVSYTLKNNGLVMEIRDNGIGIKGSYPQSKQHRSLALEITKERVSLMNKKANEKVIFSINEAFPEREERKGVMVTFCFPLNLSF